MNIIYSENLGSNIFIKGWRNLKGVASISFLLYLFIYDIFQILDGPITNKNIKNSPKRTHFKSSQEIVEQPKSLFDGVYDEDLNAQAFQDALEEWRKSGKTTTESKNSGCSVSGKCFKLFSRKNIFSMETSNFRF